MVIIKVKLVAYSQWNPILGYGYLGDYASDPAHIVATGKRICQSTESLETIYNEVRKVKGRIKSSIYSDPPHLGCLEHISFTFLIEGISRVETHQQVRHRMASYLQMSQRVVPVDDLELIIPPSIKDTAWEPTIKNFEKELKKLYRAMVDDGIDEGDARYIMPHGMETRIWVTMNGRSLLHFFRERLINPRAQWEIKEVAQKMHDELMKVCPEVFSLEYKERWE